MIFKTGVESVNVQPPIWYAVGVAEMIYRYQDLPLIITSLTDSHADRPQSLHNQGLAVDLRIKHIPIGLVQPVFNSIQSILNPMGFDIVLETDHIHIEYDPKPGEFWQKMVTV